MKTNLSLILDMETLSVSNLLIILLISTILGMALSGIFLFTHRKEVYDKSFPATLLLLPLVIAIIIALVSDNLARAFSLAGVFTLVRFRTAIADSRDITYILASVAIGLSTALGYIHYALIITAFISLVFVCMNLLSGYQVAEPQAKLKILVAENMQYTHAFDDIFKKNLKNYKLQKVKTTDFGTMFELTYFIKMNKQFNQKQFLDDLRVRNGNLNISLSSDFASLIEENS